MARNSVTGKTTEELEEMRENHKKDEPFEKTYCLAKIPNQPEEYDGPQRYCSSSNTLEVGSSHLCKHHGGAGSGNAENLEKLAAMKHGMEATREHLIEDFDEKDQKLYDWIMEDYMEAYDISFDNSPADVYDLHRLAAEIVRAERGRGYLINEGEVTEQKVRNDEGRIVTDEKGNIVTEKSEHYLAQMMHRQDKKITQLQKELGITRKERLRRDNSEDAVEAITKGFSELGTAFLQRDETDYDPEEEPWDEDAE